MDTRIQYLLADLRRLAQAQNISDVDQTVKFKLVNAVAPEANSLLKELADAVKGEPKSDQRHADNWSVIKSIIGQLRTALNVLPEPKRS